MSRPYAELPASQVRVLPLSERKNLTQLEQVSIDPAAAPADVPSAMQGVLDECVERIRAACEAGAGVMLVYGAHLVKNGAGRILDELMRGGWVTHLATNGAGTIHDWEFAFQGQSSESVRDNVATGTFGTWDETGRNIHLALLAGGLEQRGYGESLGRFIHEDGVTLPDPAELLERIKQQPQHAATPARWELWRAMSQFQLEPGRHDVAHPWKPHSIIGQAYAHEIPMTVHPGIGYDIIANHPWFNGAVIGRAAQIDFARFAASVETLDGGVVLSIGSAIMGPQVFEKALSCVNNVRLQEDREVVRDHAIFIVDLQDGGNWDWSTGEPPRDNPAYYLRFCKSYARMGGTMHYVQLDNTVFVHNLYRRLSAGFTK